MRDNITVTLTPTGKTAGKPRSEPVKAVLNPVPNPTMDPKIPLFLYEFEFKNVPIGTYQLTAKGKPTGIVRPLKELDPVAVEVRDLDDDPIVRELKLTIE
jgi:hypothetical protein